MTKHRTDFVEEPEQTMYEIRVKELLDRVFWADSFRHLEITVDPNRKETVLIVSITDQAELYGLLSRLRNNGLTLISVQRFTPESNSNSKYSPLREIRQENKEGKSQKERRA